MTRSGLKETGLVWCCEEEEEETRRSSSYGVCGSVGGDRSVGKSSQHEEVVSLGLPELGTGSRQRVRQEFRAVDERKRRR